MTMSTKLEDWIQECISKGTFANRDDAIEFAVGAMRAYCETYGITQGYFMPNGTSEPLNYVPLFKFPAVLPLKWNDEIDIILRQFGKESMVWKAENETEK